MAVSSSVRVSTLPAASCVKVVRLPGSSICVGSRYDACHCVVIVRARGVRSIFATGYDASFLPLAFRDAIYLQKPIDLAALVRAVKESSRSNRSHQN